VQGSRIEGSATHPEGAMDSIKPLKVEIEVQPFIKAALDFDDPLFFAVEKSWKGIEDWFWDMGQAGSCPRWPITNGWRLLYWLRLVLLLLGRSSTSNWLSCCVLC